jgi:hypothetical protein
MEKSSLNSKNALKNSCRKDCYLQYLKTLKSYSIKDVHISEKKKLFNDKSETFDKWENNHVCVLKAQYCKHGKCPKVHSM